MSDACRFRALLACRTAALRWLLACTGAACAGETAASDHPPTGPMADVARRPPGIPDRGEDPAVVAIDAGGQVLCSGALIAPDVVLTARSCVVMTAPGLTCPALHPQVLAGRDPRSLRILDWRDGGFLAQERARGRGVVVPAGDTLCGADIALVLLDATIDEIRPLSVRATGAAQGDHVRTIAFGRIGSGAIGKIVRDHIEVLESGAEEVVLAESVCERALGGPALDETTSEVVGVSSRAEGPSCAGLDAAAVYTRSDVFFSLIATALSQSSGTVRGGSKLRTKKGPIDMGSTCAQGSDCATGVCVTSNDRQYCSRTCNPHDRCPARFRCAATREAVSVCAEP